jgi:hypothetical protein
MENKKKRYFWKWINRISRLAAIIGLFWQINTIPGKIVQIQKQEQHQTNMTNIDILTPANDSVKRNGDIKGDADFKMGLPYSGTDWIDEDKSDFFIDEDGFYCVKKNREDYSYLALHYVEPLKIGDTTYIIMNTKENLEVDVENRNHFFSYVYMRATDENFSYVMTLPNDNESKRLVGFKSKYGDHNPRRLSDDLNIYKGSIEVHLSIEDMKNSSDVNFYYKISYVSDDEYEERIPSEGYFTERFDPSSEDYYFGIAVHRNGPCFKIDSYEQVSKTSIGSASGI